MKLFIDTHREILSKDTVTSSSSRFTWDEGYETKEIYTTTYRAHIIVEIYCDNPEKYRALGGLVNDLEENLSGIFPEGDVSANTDLLRYTGLKLIKYGPILLDPSLPIDKRIPDSWLCLERVDTIEDMEQFHYAIINIADEKTGLSLVRSVNVNNTYTKTY